MIKQGINTRPQNPNALSDNGELMVRTTKHGRQVGTGPMRHFVVTLLDDPPERSEAIAFFSRLERPIRAASALPPEIDAMDSEKAQLYLNSNPQEQRCELLRILPQDMVRDDDLHRLEFIPELLHVYLYGVGNDALIHLKHLKKLEGLAVYSDTVTDNGLIHLRDLHSLQTIDFQGSPNVSRSAFFDAVSELSSIVDAYPPQTNGG